MDLKESFKCTNIYIIGISEDKRERDKIFEKLMAENFPGLIKDVNIYIQESQ